MIGCVPFWFGIGFWWWIFPVIMIALCLLMMRGCIRKVLDRTPFSARNGKISGASIDGAEEFIETRK